MIFREAKLQSASFRNARLREADFYGANLKETDFTLAHVHGADFRRAENMDQAHWEGCRYDSRTKFPKDFDPQEHGALRDSE